jgi:signal transduction histidine kinase
VGVSLIVFFYLLMIVSIGVFSGFALEYRNKSVVRIFLYCQAAFVSWCFFNLLVFFTDSFEIKTYFANLRFIGISLLTPLWLILCSELFDHKFILKNQKYLFLIPIIVIIFAVTPSLNHLLITDFKIVNLAGINALSWRGGPILTLHLLYAYALLAYVLVVCFRGIKKEGPYKGTNAKIIILVIAMYVIPEFTGFFLLPEFRILGINVLSQALTSMILFYILHRVQLVRSFSATKDNLFETIPSSIIVLNQNGILSLYNKAAGKEFNLSLNEIGKNYNTSLPSNLCGPISKFFKTSIHEKDFTISTIIGNQTKHYKIITHSLKHKSLGGVGLIIVLENISHLKEIENELIEKNQHLAAVNEELINITKTNRKLLSLISHDVIGNLSSIQLLSHFMLENTVKHDTKTLDNNLALLADYAEQTLSLTNEVLVWTTHMTDSSRALKKKLDFASLIYKTLDQLKPVSSRKEIKIVTEIKTTSDDFQAEEKMIYVIVRNIMANALKFSKEKTEIYVKLNHEENSIIFTVTDSGPGLKDNLSIESEKGFGLGLQFTREFIAYHNGSLTLENNRPSGTKVTVVFPLAPLSSL